MVRTEQVAGPVELIAVAAGLLVGAGLAVYPVQHHAGFALAVIGALALVVTVWLRFRRTAPWQFLGYMRDDGITWADAEPVTYVHYSLTTRRGSAANGYRLGSKSPNHDRWLEHLHTMSPDQRDE